MSLERFYILENSEVPILMWFYIRKCLNSIYPIFKKNLLDQQHSRSGGALGLSAISF